MPELRKRLTTGFVHITSTPTDIEVRRDGKSTDLRTPITLDEIKPGEHRIELFKKGYRLWSDTVTVIVEQTASISSTLAKSFPESIICVKVANMAGNAGHQLYAVNTEDGTARMIRDFGSSRMLTVFALKPTDDRFAVGSGGRILIIDQLGSDITSFDVGEKVPCARTKIQFTFEPEIHALDCHPTKNRLLVTYGVYIVYRQSNMLCPCHNWHFEGSKGGTNESYQPEELDISIGGYSGPSYRISWIIGYLEYQAAGRGFSFYEPNELIEPASDEWQRFLAALDAIRIWYGKTGTIIRISKMAPIGRLISFIMGNAL